ncbi:MAG: DUF2934 domain-containing protein [Candidatus Thiodiazotropha sp.]|jgi:hypothetical protein
MGKKHKKNHKESEPKQSLENKKKAKKGKKDKKRPKDKQDRKSAKAAVATPVIEPEMRHQMIATAAYYIAERQGFDASKSLEYWQQAEKEIDNLLGKKT